MGCKPARLLPSKPRGSPRGRPTVGDRDPARQGHAGRAACKNFPSSSGNSAGKPTLPPALGRASPGSSPTLRPARPGPPTRARPRGARGAAAPQHLRARARGSLGPRRALAGPRGLPGGRAAGALCCPWWPRAAGARAPAPPPRLSLLLLRLPPPIPPSLPLSEHSMSERSEDDVGAFSNPVSLGCCCRRNREKATRRKSNGDTGSQSAQSGGVSGQTLVLLDRRRQITLLRQ